MRKYIFLFCLMALFFAERVYCGTSYYVDPSARSGGNGSYSRPWNSIDQVNAHRFVKGDDLYFKAGATLEMTDKLTIDWDGSAKDPAIVGAYYGDGEFGLGGSSRQILRGSYRRGGPNVPSGDYDALIHCSLSGAEYITVQDLALLESYSGGISFSAPTGGGSLSHIVAKNCLVRDNGRQGISFGATRHSLIEDCVVEEVCQRKIMVAQGRMKNAGAAIVIIGSGDETRSMYNTIRGCTVARAFEGIGVYRGSTYGLVEDNVVYDVVEMSIYVNNARNATVRNNLVYIPANSWQPTQDLHNLIQMDSEGHIDTIKKLAGGHEVYNNYLAGGRYGIVLASRSNKKGAYQTDNKIYNNRIVDCKFSIGFRKGRDETMDDLIGWKNNATKKLLFP